jgi:glycosyltransferase involved in cell wall biosynthesis
MTNENPELSIILPTYNEVKSLKHVIVNWHEFLAQRNIQYEFVVCEDGSTDGTKELIIELLGEFPVINETSLERRGYGGGVRAGIKASKGDYILCIDSDGQCMPDSFEQFWDNKSLTDILIGIRSPRRDPTVRKIYSFLFLILHRVLFPSSITDPSCPYILAKQEIFTRLSPSMKYMREGFWWGFVGAGLQKKMTFSQYPIKHYERYDGSSVVYEIAKMPSIICRNIIGLIKLRING